MPLKVLAPFTAMINGRFRKFEQDQLIWDLPTERELRQLNGLPVAEPDDTSQVMCPYCRSVFKKAGHERDLIVMVNGGTITVGIQTYSFHAGDVIPETLLKPIQDANIPTEVAPGYRCEKCKYEFY